MKVITRSGNKEDVRFDLITDKIKNLSDADDRWGKKLNTDPVFVAQNICSLIFDVMTPKELEDLPAAFLQTFLKKNQVNLNWEG